jgi:hypothetical protein
VRGYGVPHGLRAFIERIDKHTTRAAPRAELLDEGDGLLRVLKH